MEDLPPPTADSPRFPAWEEWCLLRICELYWESSDRRDFWIQISAEMSDLLELDYSWQSCGQMVKELTDARRKQLRTSKKTGGSDEEESGITAAIDVWIRVQEKLVDYEHRRYLTELLASQPPTRKRARTPEVFDDDEFGANYPSFSEEERFRPGQRRRTVDLALERDRDNSQRQAELLARLDRIDR
ncbi:hypothetical protein VTN77DRAFT_1087 [Rasamsonia byssochlamydoides]|uniref:uncharacterized protein n=1 Tax=Rasamsonia byssochlamydoides TaxID=89139 RepID=UPI003741EB4C